MVLQIPDGTTSTVAMATTPVIPAAIAGSARFCGRQLNSISGVMTASTSVCSKYRPFLQHKCHLTDSDCIFNFHRSGVSIQDQF